MGSTTCKAIHTLLDTFSDHPSVAPIRDSFQEQTSISNRKGIIDLYRQSISFIEKEIWSAEPDDSLIELYQQLFREMERQFTPQESAERHHFTVVIPVADRPQQLGNCIDTLFELCKRFGYGGSNISKVSVLIADDSKEPENIRKNRLIADQYNHKGLITDYFGLSEQQETIDRLSES